MRRITSLFMIVVLVSITSLPVLPKAAVCHAAEANAACDTCHPQESVANSSIHDMHAQMIHHDAPKHSDHDQKQHDHQNMEQPKEMHKHQKQLSAAEKGCRIECGCGCNHSMDGLPNLLSPHLTSATGLEVGESTVRIEVTLFSERPLLTATVPSPPPKLI